MPTTTALLISKNFGREQTQSTLSQRCGSRVCYSRRTAHQLSGSASLESTIESCAAPILVLARGKRLEKRPEAPPEHAIFWMKFQLDRNSIGFNFTYEGTLRHLGFVKYVYR